MIQKSENFKIISTEKENYVIIVPLEKLPTVLENCKMSQKNLEECGNMRYTKVEIYPDYIFGTINIPNKKKLFENSTQLAFYIDEHHVIYVGKTDEECNIIQKLLSGDDKTKNGIQHSLYRLIYQIIEDDYQFIEALEENINKMEEEVLQDVPDRLNQKLLETRKTLLYFHNFYERMLNIVEMLSDNDYNFFSKDVILCLNHFKGYLNRLDGSIHTLLDYSMQVQQIYQAEIDIKQNHIMKILTSVTTIFLPLTLIVGWYGMNFTGMPELKWQFGYPMVIVLSLVIIGILVAIFKKNKYF